MCYESLLQERVPDALRGRVMAAAEAILDGAFLVGAVAAGVIGDHLGVRVAFGLSGFLFLAASAMTVALVVRSERGDRQQRSDRELEQILDGARELVGVGAPIVAEAPPASRGGSPPPDLLWVRRPEASSRLLAAPPQPPASPPTIATRIDAVIVDLLGPRVGRSGEPAVRQPKWPERATRPPSPSATDRPSPRNAPRPPPTPPPRTSRR